MDKFTSKTDATVLIVSDCLTLNNEMRNRSQEASDNFQISSYLIFLIFIKTKKKIEPTNTL